MIITLNCHIIKFLLRALDWYEANTMSRAIQSITRPAALRYDDIVEDIRSTLSKVNSLSLAGSQAEQRDMHEELRTERVLQEGFRKIVQSRLDEMQYQIATVDRQKDQERRFQAMQQHLQDLTALVHQMKNDQSSNGQTLLQEIVVMKQDIKATQADMRLQLSDIQLMQAFSIISNLCTIDPKSAYEYGINFRRVRKLSTSAKCAPFWNSQQLQTWDQAPSHSFIVLQASFSDRLSIRDFCIGVIEQILHSDVAILWVLPQKNAEYSLYDVLKSLISQALRRDISSHTDVVVSSHIRTLHAAHSLEEYAALLASILTRLKVVYIVIDTGAMTSSSVEECRRIFVTFPEVLKRQNPDTVLKVIFVKYGLSRLLTGDNGRIDTQSQIVLRVGQTSMRKGKKVPRAPLKSKSRFGLRR